MLSCPCPDVVLACVMDGSEFEFEEKTIFEFVGENWMTRQGVKILESACLRNSFHSSEPVAVTYHGWYKKLHHVWTMCELRHPLELMLGRSGAIALYIKGMTSCNT